jgi:hypothetical protein
MACRRGQQDWRNEKTWMNNGRIWKDVRGCREGGGIGVLSELKERMNFEWD